MKRPDPIAHPLARTLLLSLALLGLNACTPLAIAPTPTPAATPPGEPVQVRLMAFNDFHGHLDSSDQSLTLADPASPGKAVRLKVGGAAALSGLTQALRQSAPHSVLISGGDLVGAAPLVSSLFLHESTIDVMNRLGLDLGVVGNHEFDSGRAELLRLVRGGCAKEATGAASTSAISTCALGPFEGARFTLLAGNVLREDDTPLLPAYSVREFGGVKVGFIGAVTRSTPSIVLPSGVAGLRFEDEAGAINRAAAQLKQQGVHTLVAVVHEGGSIGAPGQRADWNDEQCPGAQGEIFNIARQLVPEVQVVFSAHTHQGYRCVIDGRTIIQATSYGRGLSVVDLSLNPVTGRVDPSRTLSRNLPVINERSDTALREAIAASYPEAYAQALRQAQPDAAVAERVQAYASAAAPRAGRPVGQIKGHFDGSGKTDSSAGRLIADAQLAATRSAAAGGAQLALMNPGGIRASLGCRETPPCTVSYGDVYSMQPFGNSLVVMTLKGSEIRALLESQAPKAPGQGPHLLMPSAGLSYRWVASAPAGQHVQDLRLQGQSLQPERDYRITVNSFLAEGGDGFTLLKQGRDRTGGPLDLEALIDHLATVPAPVKQARISWQD
jgi:5'-nucleotidase